MKVTKKIWQDKMNNLHSREKGISSEHQIPYKELLKKVYIGNRVLDVGCGTCWLKNMLPPDTIYNGIDSFASEIKECEQGILDGYIIQVDIDSFNWTANDKWTGLFETIFCFAALDGMRDLDKAFENMKRIASKNIVLLTGINIEPDQYHTHLITLDYLRKQMDGWKETVNVEVMKDKIVFLEFTRI